MQVTVCWYCEDTIDTRAAGTMREITGWEELRRGGGANKITARETTGKWAHRACVQYRIRQQESLL